MQLRRTYLVKPALVQLSADAGSGTSSDARREVFDIALKDRFGGLWAIFFSHGFNSRGLGSCSTVLSCL